MDNRGRGQQVKREWFFFDSTHFFCFVKKNDGEEKNEMKKQSNGFHCKGHFLKKKKMVENTQSYQKPQKHVVASVALSLKSKRFSTTKKG